MNRFEWEWIWRFGFAIGFYEKRLQIVLPGGAFRIRIVE